MDPLEFLTEEFENVKRALKETLRHDYIPERSQEYYDECGARLTEIKKAISVVDPGNLQKIAALLDELSHLANWISLIERSHLGEFSWPFAAQLDRLARALLAEQNMAGDRLEPIIHVVAEGLGYRIIYEPQVPASSGRRRFVVVAFPRSLKHHVLLHAIFGHELAHTALHTGAAGGVLHGAVVPALTAAGPISTNADINAWLNDAAAPQEIRDALANYAATYQSAYALHDYYREQWLKELICDLFGLLLFGPAFLAAHCALLKPTHPRPYEVDLSEPTHPPYAVRHKMLVRVMQLVGWDAPVTAGGHTPFHNAEQELLGYILQDPYAPWARVFTDAQLTNAIGAVRGLFKSQPGIGYSRSDVQILETLVRRLVDGIPPVIVDIDDWGEPYPHLIDISQTLYAGWLFWLGRNHLPNHVPDNFLDTNKLCDMALLQQRAINIAITPGELEWRSWVDKP